MITMLRGWPWPSLQLTGWADFRRAQVLDRAVQYGCPGLVISQTGSIAYRPRGRRRAGRSRLAADFPCECQARSVIDVAPDLGSCARGICGDAVGPGVFSCTERCRQDATAKGRCKSGGITLPSRSPPTTGYRVRDPFADLKEPVMGNIA
jgi:hypothetical protein